MPKLNLIVTNKFNAEYNNDICTPHGIISIWGFDEPIARLKFNEYTKNTLYLHFDDIDDDRDFRAIKITHVELLFNWLHLAFEQETIRTLKIHCAMGISRSAAVAAALSKIFNGDDNKFFRLPFIPNKLVYSTILNYWVFNIKGANTR